MKMQSLTSFSDEFQKIAHSGALRKEALDFGGIGQKIKNVALADMGGKKWLLNPASSVGGAVSSAASTAAAAVPKTREAMYAARRASWRPTP